MGTLTPEEEAINDATRLWEKLPATVARAAQVKAILQFEGATFDADGVTRAQQTFIALDQQNPIPPVVPWMRQEKMWPFDA